MAMWLDISDVDKSQPTVTTKEFDDTDKFMEAVMAAGLTKETWNKPARKRKPKKQVVADPVRDAALPPSEIAQASKNKRQKKSKKEEKTEPNLDSKEEKTEPNLDSEKDGTQSTTQAGKATLEGLTADANQSLQEGNVTVSDQTVAEFEKLIREVSTEVKPPPTCQLQHQQVATDNNARFCTPPCFDPFMDPVFGRVLTALQKQPIISKELLKFVVDYLVLEKELKNFPLTGVLF